MKLPYAAACKYESRDTLTVEATTDARDGVRLEARGTDDRYISVYLTPAEARRLAKALKKAAKKAEAAS